MFLSDSGIELRPNRAIPERIWCAGLIAAMIATVAVAASGPDKDPGPATHTDQKTNHAAFKQLPWTDANCGSCHDADRLLMHPTEVTPSMPVPDGLPLLDGQITCITCHESTTPKQHAAARSNHSDLLRMPAEQLCAQCHIESTSSSSNAHASLVTKAHLNTKDPHAGQSLPGIDAQSLTCMSCHDGSMNLGFSSTVASAQTTFMPGFHNSPRNTQSHPIGVEYPSHPRHGARAMVPQSRLDSRIRLFDNAIGCGSCHSPYSQEKDLLVINNRASQLCLSCHAL